MTGLFSNLTLALAPEVMAVLVFGGIGLLVLLVGIFILIIKCYRKVEPGTALVIRGRGGPKAEFNGKIVVPVLHRADVMDVSVKRLEIYRHGSEGLICQDNVRADIKVA